VAVLREVDAPNVISREMQEQVIRVTAKIEAADKQGVSQKSPKN
jgi:Cu/Ag efflux pump CusA